MVYSWARPGSSQLVGACRPSGCKHLRGQSCASHGLYANTHTWSLGKALPSLPAEAPGSLTGLCRIALIVQTLDESWCGFFDVFVLCCHCFYAAEAGAC